MRRYENAAQSVVVLFEKSISQFSLIKPCKKLWIRTNFVNSATMRKIQRQYVYELDFRHSCHLGFFNVLSELNFKSFTKVMIFW